MDEDKIITVYNSGDKLETTRLVAVLKENGIDSFIQNTYTQDLFGLGRMGTGYNLAVGTYNIQIRESDYQQSVKIIKESLGLNEEEAEEEVDKEAAVQNTYKQAENSSPEHSTAAKVVNNYDWAKSVLLSMFWVMGIGSAAGIFFGIKGFKSKPVFSLIGIVLGIIGLIFALVNIRILWDFILIVVVLSIPTLLAVYGLLKYKKTGKPLFLILMLTGCLLLIVVCLLPVLVRLVSEGYFY